MPKPMNTRQPSRRSLRGFWRRMLLYLLFVLVAVAIVIGLWPQPIPVDTAVVARGPMTVTVLEEGKTRIRHRYVVSSPVGGSLRRVPLRAGAPIQSGQTVLATIEVKPSDFLDPRMRAEAEARLEWTEAIRMQRESEVERARIAHELAQRDFSRLDALRRQGIIAQQEWDAAENRVEILSRDLHSAAFALRAAEFEITQARATLRPAALPDADSASSVTIVAPINGYVLNVYEESARVIAAGEPILEIGNPQDLEAEIELLSSDAVAVAPGADVLIEQWGGATPLRARVELVEPGAFTKISALGVEEQRVLTRVRFLEEPPPGQALGDRYRVEARIVIWSDDDVLQTPTGALFRRGNTWTAFVVEDGLARLREVTIGHNNGVMAQTLSGLRQGEVVIVYPPDSLTDGKAVAPSSDRSRK